MKRTVYLAAALTIMLATGAEAQVTIGANDAPKVTLDVRGKAATATSADGLTENAKNNIKLGGTLSENTTIAHGSYTLTHSGTGKEIISTPLQITSGSPGETKVLTSDASGNATWQPSLTASTYRGTAVPQQKVSIPCYAKEEVYIDTINYIDLPKGLWRVDMSMPFQIKDATPSTGGSVEISVGLTSIIIDPGSAASLPNGNFHSIMDSGQPASAGSVAISGNHPANTASRGNVTFFLDNTNSGITRFYTMIGRYAEGRNLVPNGLLYLPEGRGCGIYATSMQWAN
ncbi:MAG: hypothetical protein LBR64_03755 [Dysgonamonadaceae bacterium]|jgi:hypothetical protein|nr:hypothetical protein [Dysgonamonadaceae bacterium]